MSHLYPRTKRVVAGLAILSAFAIAPVAQAADTDAEGTLTGGSLTNTAPVITPFAVTLSGVAQDATPALSAWSVTDATGTNDGYSITVSATAPTVDGLAADAGTGAAMTLTASTATAAAGNLAATGPVGTGAQVLDAVEDVSIADAAAATGQGQWNFAAGSGLTVVIPGDASAGAYSSTLTYTAGPLVP